MIKYSPEIEENMKRFYTMLSEKDRRRYAAIEATKLGYGGISYIASLFGCSRKTIYAGIADLENIDSTTTDDRVRNPGGGRKSIYETIPNIEEKILEILQEHSAGSPTSECKWTDLHPREISEYLEIEGIFVSHVTIRKIMKNLGF